MPTYINRILADMDFRLRCPFCSNGFKAKSGLITHTKHCDGNPDSQDSLDNIIVDDYSASHMIKWQEEVSKLVKELINTNELALISTQTPEQIRENIRLRMRQRIGSNYSEESDIYSIYEFFFGLSETDIASRNEEFYNRMKEMFDPQDDTNSN